MAYVIDQSRCINCAWCRRECPTDTIRYFDTDVRKHRIEPSGCIDCDICAQVCPTDCITHDPTIVLAPPVLEAAKEKARRWAGDRRRLRLAIRTYATNAVARAAPAVAATALASPQMQSTRSTEPGSTAGETSLIPRGP